MMETKSKVYVLTDAEGRIIRIDGGYTIGNIPNIEQWVLIDEGDGDRFNLCQNNYLPKPLTDERGVYRYKLVDGQCVERTQQEMEEDYRNQPLPAPTQMDFIEAQIIYTAMMTNTLLEG